VEEEEEVPQSIAGQNCKTMFVRDQRHCTNGIIM